jgi:general secretion pathway protein D
MVFLRPVVVRDTAQSDALSLDRYDLMRGKQEAAQPSSSIVTPINAGPVMPPARRPAAPVPPGAEPAPVLPPTAVPAPLGR